MHNDQFKIKYGKMISFLESIYFFLCFVGSGADDISSPVISRNNFVAFIVDTVVPLDFMPIQGQSGDL